MPYLSLSSIVAEANRAANDAERLLDTSLLQARHPPEEKKVELEDPATLPEDNSGQAGISLAESLKKIFNSGKGRAAQ